MHNMKEGNKTLVWIYSWRFQYILTVIFNICVFVSKITKLRNPYSERAWKTHNPTTISIPTNQILVSGYHSMLKNKQTNPPRTFLGEIANARHGYAKYKLSLENLILSESREELKNGNMLKIQQPASKGSSWPNLSNKMHNNRY